MDEQYDDTLPIRVVVTPTLIIPVYQVKPRKRRKQWAQRIALAAIIVTWILLATITAFLFWMIMISGRMIP